MVYTIVRGGGRRTVQARKCGRAEAQDRARWFLEQHYSVLTSHASMENGVWVVIAQVGLNPKQTKSVSVDPASGAILGCT